MNRQAITLIFDIGKTTKKALVFDQHFHTLEEQTQTFAESKDDDGFPSENIHALTNWVTEILEHYSGHRDFLVTHINFSAYGASLVHLSRDGERIEPFFNYLKPFPETCKKEFLNRYNNSGDLLTTTASPFLGLLNSGLQLYWLKHQKPTLFATIGTSLHFPQYFTYHLTRQKLADITSVGCHTLLWDYQRQDYHRWVDHEHLRALFPTVRRADFTTEFQYRDRMVTIGIGVHDSSASLMPYLVVMKEKFLLLSTGTWNICFNPFNDTLLSKDELSQDCLCFLTYEGKPVKASRIFLGHEHELQQQALAAHYQTDNERYKSIAFNAALYGRLKDEAAFVDFCPLGMQGTGPNLAARSSPTPYDSFENFEEAQHQLISQLVRWQKIAVDLIDPACEVKNLIVVGGFTKSKLFLPIMKAEFPDRKILISDHPRAAALGAAWLVCGKDAYAGKTDLLNVMPV